MELIRVATTEDKHFFGTLFGVCFFYGVNKWGIIGDQPKERLKIFWNGYLPTSEPKRCWSVFHGVVGIVRFWVFAVMKRTIGNAVMVANL